MLIFLETLFQITKKKPIIVSLIDYIECFDTDNSMFYS